MSQLISINLGKSPGVSWGFRLQGGKDFAQPLCIQKVNPGSVAAQAGVQTGDAIVRIGDVDALTLRHKEAQDAILKAGNSFTMQVQRGSITWKPAVTALAQPAATPQGPVATKTSLAAPGKLAPVKYNSPIGLYTEDNIADALNAQAEVLGVGKTSQKEVLGVNFKKHDNVNKDSALLKMVQEMDTTPKKKPEPLVIPSAYSGTHTPSEMIGTPEIPVQGASFRILEKLLTDEDRMGYYNVNDKMYCDVHAKQAANPPAPNLVPVTVKPGDPVPKGAVAAPPKGPTKLVPSIYCGSKPTPFKVTVS